MPIIVLTSVILLDHTRPNALSNVVGISSRNSSTSLFSWVFTKSKAKNKLISSLAKPIAGWIVAIKFTPVKIDENPEARDFLLGQGFKSVPQIFSETELFVEGGYQGLSKLTDEELTTKLG